MTLNYWLLRLSDALEGWWGWTCAEDGETFWVSGAAREKSQKWKCMTWVGRTGSQSPTCMKGNEAGLEAKDKTQIWRAGMPGSGALTSA